MCGALGFIPTNPITQKEDQNRKDKLTTPALWKQEQKDGEFKVNFSCKLGSRDCLGSLSQCVCACRAVILNMQGATPFGVASDIYAIITVEKLWL